MTTRQIALVEHEFYHVYNRGTEKRTIFLNNTDYRRFVELLYLCNSKVAINFRDIQRDFDSVYDFDRGESIVAIGLYCLMPNHFHILITPLVEGGVSSFMGKLTTSYSMYFNKKYDRNGNLFQGTFKAEHVNNDEYLKYLYAYIHLNPVKLIDPKWKEEGVKDVAKSYDFATSFNYSSLKDYLGVVRPENNILNKSAFPRYFSDSKEVSTDLFEWITFNPKFT